MRDLYLGFDLGGDSLKVAYAFKHSGIEMSGKVFMENTKLQAGLSAKALYDKESNQWYFGDQIEKAKVEDFTNTIKIKELFNLLKRVRNRNVEKENVKYYTSEHYFPKFKFPYIVGHEDDFSQIVKKQDVFEAQETPQEICERYFYYVRDKIDFFIAQISEEYGFDQVNIKIAIVYPTSAGEQYRNEFERIVRHVFGEDSVFKALNSTRAISYWALKSKLFKSGDHFLVFDLGEETISVVKGNVGSNGEIMLDGADGHSRPINIGGVDIDNAVLDYLSKQIADRETLGYPSAGEEGHLYEQPLRSKQYLLMNNIKQAKILFGKDSYEEMFKDGVPISIVREVLVQRFLKKEEFQSCLGLMDDKGDLISQKVIAYIEEESNKVINKEVNKIVLAGGVAETSGLVEFVNKRIKGKKVITFDNILTNSVREEFKISKTEESVYAAAVGGALVALDDYKITILFSRNYGTIYTLDGGKYFSQFEGAKKGGRIKIPKGSQYCEFWTTQSFSIYYEGVRDDEILACSSDLDYKYIGNDKHAQIGAIGSILRENLRREKGLEQLVHAEIWNYYRGKRIVFEPGYKGSIQEGLLVDIDGNAIPKLRNSLKAERGNPTVKVRYFGDQTTPPFVINAKEIEYRFSKEEEDLTIAVTTK